MAQQSPESIGVICKVQRWMPAARYFEVEGPPPSGVVQAPFEAGQPRQEPHQQQSHSQPRPPPPQQPQQQQQAQQSPPQQRQQQEQQQSNIVSETWEQHCRFDVVLQGGTNDKLVFLASPGRNLSHSAVASTVRELLQAGSDLLPSVPSFVKKRLARLDARLDVSALPFSSESAGVLSTYADEWSRAVLFLVRAEERLESEEQARASGVLPAWRVFNALSVEQRTSVADLSSDDVAARRTALLEVSRFCIDQSLSGNGQDSAILVAFACMCIRSPDKWLQPSEALPVINGILYCSRLFSLLAHLTQYKLWDPAALAVTQLFNDDSATELCYEMFQDRHKETLSRTSATAFPRLADIGSWRASTASGLTPGALSEASGSGSRQSAVAAPGSSRRSDAPRIGQSSLEQQSAATSDSPRQPQAGPSSRVQRGSEEVDEPESSAPEPGTALSFRQAQKRRSTSVSQSAEKRQRQVPVGSDDDEIVFVSSNVAGSASGQSRGRRSQRGLDG